MRADELRAIACANVTRAERATKRARAWRLAFTALHAAATIALAIFTLYAIGAR